MDFKEVAKTVAQFAPILGSALAGPAGASIGTLLSSIFGAAAGSASDLQKKIESDPFSEQKLIAFETSHKQELEKLALQNEVLKLKIETHDTQDARKTYLSALKLGAPGWVITGLAFSVSFFFFMVIGMLLTRWDNPGSHDFLYLLTGQLAGAFTTVIAFYFGSSRKRNN